jgi:uncharacterized protein YeaO (DUF488 family)
MLSARNDEERIRSSRPGKVQGCWDKTMSKKPDIQVKRAYLPAEPEDGERILVDRLWPRGVSKETLAATWLKDIAPSTELRKWFHSAPAQWEAFERRYREELDANPEALAKLRSHLKGGRVTFVYGARDEAHNHAVVLRDYVLSHRDKG